jgi:hypothetical protein
MQGSTLTDSEMEEMVDIFASSIDLPLLSESSARPLMRSVVGSLFGPQKLKLVTLDWSSILSSGIGIENTEYREKLAIDLAASISVPGMREEQEVAIAKWLLDKTRSLAVKVLPPRLLPMLRASSTKDLEKMRPTIAASLLDTINKVPLGVGVILPKKTKEKLANIIVDYLYENYVNNSTAVRASPVGHVWWSHLILFQHLVSWFGKQILRNSWIVWRVRVLGFGMRANVC